MLYRVLAIGTALLLLAGCATTMQKPPEPPPVCGKLDDILRGLEKNARYAYTADAIDSHGRVHEWFINPKTRHWVQIHVYSNLRACIEDKGYDWHWAVETHPQKPVKK
jgi:hypothetical protein